MRLSKIVIHKKAELINQDDGYWVLLSDFYATYHTDCGVYHLELLAGWITDLRSGSEWVDAIVPKRGNDIYNAVIMFHDTMYSGWCPKSIADEILRQGIIFSGISEWRANLAYKAVDLFGSSGYYFLEDDMPEPYSHNRSFELLQYLDK
jgi:hypothetical protein